MSSLEKYISSTLAVSAGDLEIISRSFESTELFKGEFFSRRGRLCDSLAFIEKGYIRVYLENTDREVTQWISTPGFFLTDLSSFILQTDARWNMQALSDCKLLKINRSRYHDLCKDLPVWRDIDHLLIVKCFIMMEERIFSHLHMSSDERFEQLMATQPELFNLVPLQYLASMLGMTPETLSRLRKKSNKKLRQVSK